MRLDEGECKINWKWSPDEYKMCFTNVFLQNVKLFKTCLASFTLNPYLAYFTQIMKKISRIYHFSFNPRDLLFSFYYYLFKLIFILQITRPLISEGQLRNIVDCCSQFFLSTNKAFQERKWCGHESITPVSLHDSVQSRNNNFFICLEIAFINR